MTNINSVDVDTVPTKFDENIPQVIKLIKGKNKNILALPIGRLILTRCSRLDTIL
jgi:hypothetical protein